MKQSRRKLAGTIADTTLKQGVHKRYAREVAAYLLSEGRTAELDSVLRDVQVTWAANGHVEVIAASAHPLTADTRQAIEREVKRVYPSAKRIVINSVGDSEVIGGVRLSLPEQQLDLSLEAKLNKFKQLTGTGKE